MDEYYTQILFLERKSIFTFLIIFWIFILSWFTEQRLAEFLHVLCAVECLEINMNKAPQRLLVLKIAHKAMHNLVPIFLLLSSLVFCYSFYQSLSTTPILSTSHPNMFIFPNFSKHYLFCLQCSLLGLSWLFFIIHSNQVPINAFR